MRIKFLLLAATLSVCSVALAQRAPTVSFSISGGPGNYLLDFSVSNNMLPGEGSVYFFGVYLDTGRNIAGSPNPWDPNAWSGWDNTSYGGSSLVYNNNWLDLDQFPVGAISEGTSMSGFKATYTGASAPSEVPWFAYSLGGTYNGNDHFWDPSNPGFEGIAVVPEPASLTALGLGLLALTRRRKGVSS